MLTSSGGNGNYYLKLCCLRTWTIRIERSLRQDGCVLAMFLKLDSRSLAHSSTATPTSDRTLYTEGQQRVLPSRVYGMWDSIPVPEPWRVWPLKDVISRQTQVLQAE